VTLPPLFPFAEYWCFYGAFVIGVVLLLALDLGVLHRGAQVVGFREAALWTAGWITLEKNLLLRLLHRMLPVTRGFRGPRFVVREAGRLHATPLLVAVACLEATDIVFAIDSLPAIYALTREPLIVFTSNVFAILGLRSLYFLLGGAVHRFHLLRYGLAVVLVFVGLKMAWLDGLYDGRFPIGTSLGIIASVIAASIGASALFPKPARGVGPVAEEAGHARRGSEV